jgi:ankyrin repeat protein/serine/threonine protein kinase
VTHLLSELFANVNVANKDGCTALIKACEQNQLPILECILACAPNFNAKTISTGMTATNILAFHGYDELLSVLLASSDGELDVANKKGLAPLHSAITQHRSTTMEILLGAGADVNLQTVKEGFSPLHLSINENNTDAVATLIDLGADVNLADNNGCTPIYTSANKGNIELVKLLLDHAADGGGVNVNQPNSTGWSPFYAAAHKGYLEILQLLHEAGADVDNKNNAGWTPVLAAAATKSKHQVDVLRLLLSLDPDLSVRNNAGCSLAFVAAAAGNCEVLRLLIDADVDICEANNDGVSPILAATLNGHVDAVNLLIENGADCSAADTHGTTPLHAAAKLGNADIVRLFVDMETNVDDVDSENSTALFIAISNGHVEVASLLLEAGTDFSIGNNATGMSPLHAASIKGFDDIVGLLLALGADANRTNKQGITALLGAILQGKLNTAFLLLAAKGVDVNKCSNDGTTPLLAAAASGYFKVVTELVNRRANVNALNQANRSSLHAAAAGGHKDIVICLLSKGADPAVIDTAGDTALSEACRCGHLSIADALIGKMTDLNHANTSGQTYLHLAAAGGHINIVETLLSSASAVDVQKLNTNGESAVDLAAKGGHVEVLELLLSAGAMITIRSTSASKGEEPYASPLFYAAFTGNTAMISCLLNRCVGLDVDDVNSEGSTLLIVAAAEGHQETVDFLIGRKADVVAANDAGFTAVAMAARKGHLEILKALKMAGAGVYSDRASMSNRGGKRAGRLPTSKSKNIVPIFQAARGGYTEIVAFLLDCGADLLATDSGGFNLLFTAASKGHSGTVRMLLTRGIDINSKCAAPTMHDDSTMNYEAMLKRLLSSGCPMPLAKNLLQMSGADVNLSTNNYEGSTAVYVAALFGFEDVVRVLVDAAVDVNIANKEGCSPLYVACNAGNISVVKLLLSIGAKVNFANSENCTPLYAAASKGFTGIVELLITHHASVNHENNEGLVPLHAAAGGGHLECMQVLIDYGGDVNATDISGRSLLYMAAIGGNVEVIRLLLDCGADVHQASTGENCAPLFMAAKFGHNDAVKLLLGAGADVNAVANPRDYNVSTHYQSICYLLMLSGCTAEGAMRILYSAGADIDISITSQAGCTPVNISAFGGHTDVVRTLVAAGADLDIANNDGYTPLFTAAAKGRTDTFKTILEHHKDLASKTGLKTSKSYLHQRNSNGQSILHFAAERIREDIVRCLTEEGVDINATDIHTADNGVTLALIHYATVQRNEAMLRLLLSCGAHVNLQTLGMGDRTALHIACNIGAKAIAELLLEAGAVVNLKSADEMTPVAEAAVNGHVFIIHLLAGEKYKADVCIQCRNGQTALYWAAERGCLDAVLKLIELKADINQVNNAGQTPLYGAAQNGHYAVVQALIAAGADKNTASTDSSTPVFAAASNNHSNIVKLLVMSGAEFPIKLNSGWTKSKNTKVLGSYLVSLVASANEDDRCFLRKITERCTKEISSLLFYLIELDFNVLDLILEQQATCREICIDVKRRRKEYPIHAALRQFANSESRLLQLVNANSSTVTDIDYFGNTALMVAINVDAPPSVIAAILHHTLDLKLNKRFDSLTRICPKLNTKHRFPSFRLNVPIVSAKVYVEVRLLTNIPNAALQIGAAASDWDPKEEDDEQVVLVGNASNSRGERYGVGDSDCSIGFDAGRKCYFENGVTKEVTLPDVIKKWEDVVVGVCIDAVNMTIEFTVNGRLVKTNYTLSLAKYGDAGIVFALSMSPGLKCEVNFGEAGRVPLRFKPTGYRSVAEYAKNFVPIMQLRNKIYSAWEYTSPSEDCAVSKYYYDWFHVITSANESLVSVANSVIEQNSASIRELAYDMNEFEYRAMDIASKQCKKKIQSILYFMGRYDLSSSKPDYESNNSMVMFAQDSVTKQPVAIKLMRHKGHYLQELQSRQGLDSAFVINVMAHFDGDENVKFRDELARKQKTEFNYCIVMPAARRNLSQILGQENVAGKDAVVRRLFEDLVNCVKHLHLNEILHGDIKPLNIMRDADDKLVLIDLDGSCKLGTPAGLKCSPAYIPPEMLYFDKLRREYRVKRYTSTSAVAGADGSNVDADGEVLDGQSSKGNAAAMEELKSARQTGYTPRPAGGLGDINAIPEDGSVSSAQYAPLIAHSSYDVWSLGLVLYHLCTGESLFLASFDNIDQADREILFKWEDRFKRKKLDKIQNVQARNLVSRMLNKDPTKRPTLSAVLQHTYISGQAAVRMVGEEPQFDVFLSYRVGPDKKHCEKLYMMLRQRGLNVWMDAYCLKDGKVWEQGFCDGLVQSKVFVCLISAAAVADPSQKGRCFKTLTKSCHCDNVLLEHMLALELHEMTLISSIYPVFLGKTLDVPIPEVHDPFDFGCLDEMPDECVQSVVDKLAEHLDRQRLGTPLYPNRTVREVVNRLKDFQGFKVEGDRMARFEELAEKIVGLCRENHGTIPDLAKSKSMFGANLSTMDDVREYEDRIAEREKRIRELEELVVRLQQQISQQQR